MYSHVQIHYTFDSDVLQLAEYLHIEMTNIEQIQKYFR